MDQSKLKYSEKGNLKGDNETKPQNQNVKKDDFEEIDNLPRGTISKLDTKGFKPKKPIRFLMTREITRYFDRETYLRTTLIEMVIFFGFIITLAVLTNTKTTSVQYYYAKAMTGLFIEKPFKTKAGEIVRFNQISTMDHIWPYIFSVLMNNFYWTYKYFKNLNQEEKDDNLSILYSNKIIGLPRMRQVRVRNDSCEIPDDFKLMFSACYAEYSKDAEDKKSFGLGLEPGWVYSDQSTLGHHKYVGQISTYGGGGFYIDFSTKKSESNTIVQNLKNNLWIDRATRAVIIDFATYNGNINYFCFLKIIFELPATGGVLPYYEFVTRRFTYQPNAWSVVILIFQIILLIYCVLYFIEELYEIYYFKWQYIKSFWNWLDLVILVLNCTVIGLYIYRLGYVKANLKGLIKTKDSNPIFDGLLSLENSYSTSLSLLVFFGWIKFVKYLALNHSMYQMQSTLARASKDILCFSVIFFTVFIAFAQLGHLLFGSQVAAFRTFGKSIFALLRTVVGDFDFQAIENANHLLGPIYFFSYIFFIFFVLVNMFVAIIIDTYAEVRADLNAAGIKTYLSDLIGRYFNKILKLIGLKKLAEFRENRADKEFGRTTYQEIRNLLRRCGFTEQEIDLFFAKYEITEDRLISPEEMRRILYNVEDLPSNVNADATLLPLHQDLDITNAKLSERINTLEDAAIAANNKIDIILNKLDGMHQMRMSRRL